MQRFIIKVICTKGAYCRSVFTCANYSLIDCLYIRNVFIRVRATLLLFMSIVFLEVQTLKGQGDVQDLRKQLQELETRHQVVSADREAWSKKIDELTSEKMNVLQSIQQLKVMCTYYSYSNQFCLNIKPCISLLCLMIM